MQEYQLRLQFNKLGFAKYPSIDRLEKRSPYKEWDGVYYVTEKLDGSNIGLHIYADGTYEVFMRNGGLLKDACSFDYEEHKHKLDEFVECVKRIFECDFEDGKEYHFYGECIGPRINRRVPYKDVSFIFYDMVLVSDGEGIMLDPYIFCMFANIVDSEGCGQYVLKPEVIKLNEGENLVDCLPLPVKSRFADGNAEGYVITEVDYDKKLYQKWKRKDPLFEESRPRKSPAPLDNDVLEYRKIFQGYLSENRAIGVLSKTSSRDLGVLIRDLIRDAKEDFLKDFPKVSDPDFDKAKLKLIFNAGQTPFRVVSAVLSKEQ